MRIESVEGLEGHRAVELRHARVEAREERVVVAGVAVVAPHAHHRRKIRVVRRHRATLTCDDELRRAHAEHLSRTEAARQTTTMAHAETVGGVEDEGNSVAG